MHNVQSYPRFIELTKLELESHSYYGKTTFKEVGKVFVNPERIFYIAPYHGGDKSLIVFSNDIRESLIVKQSIEMIIAKIKDGEE